MSNDNCIFCNGFIVGNHCVDQCEGYYASEIYEEMIHDRIVFDM